MSAGLVWFKRDLRVEDHEPLVRAAASGPVLGLYAYEPCVLEADEHDARHLEFANDCLRELQEEFAALGSVLLIRRGDAVDVLERLWNEHRFERLYSHEETGLAVTYDRDRRVAAWCRRRGVAWHEVAQHGVVRGLKSRDGWARQWERRMRAPVLAAPRLLEPWPNVHGLRAGGIASAGELGVRTECETRGAQRGGAGEARSLLASFLSERGETYQRNMSSPLAGWDACSRLSPHLAYGSLSVRAAYQAARKRADELRREGVGGRWRGSIASFEKRLHWHCHFIQKLESEPDIEFRNMHRGYDGLRTEDEGAWSDDERLRFDAWAEGRTGYPFADACMRCLRTTGWMNFRMRSMLVSVAAYHLWLHWRPLARHLGRLFVDFEPGIHYSQVQMQSGTTGINTVRIYNPIKQGRDQDPGGVFIRRWVPELADVEGDEVHEPWRGGSLFGWVPGGGYPRPIVEHAAAYRQAQRRIFAVRKTAEARSEAKRVYDRHGSRKRGASRSAGRYRGAPEDRGVA
ncbi:MAG: deoxyribodipyrimidine photo-lyase [Planctomycetota bacterium]